MALTQDQLTQRVQLAKQQGWSDARIQNALRNTATQQPAAPAKKSNLLVQLAPLLGSIGGGLAGGLAGPAGVIAGGAAGGAAGERLRQRLSGEQTNVGNIVKEGAFGALGGIGEGIQALRVAGEVGMAAKGLKAAKGITAAEEAAQAARGAGVLGKAENAMRAGAGTMEQATRQIRLPAAVGSAQKEDAINATLDALGFKGNATKQFRQLQPAMSQVEERIGQVAKANPNVRVSAADIKASFMKNLDTQLRTGEIDAPTAQKEVQKYLGDLMKKSGGEKGQLDLTQLRDMKKLVNKDYQLIADKVAKGVPLTPQQKVAQVAWESIDSALSGASPETKALLTQQSHLYAAAPSLKAARVNPPTLRGMGSSLPVFVTDAARAGTAGALRTGANALSAAGNIAQRVGPTLGRAASIGGAQIGANAIFGNGQPQQPEPAQGMQSQYQMPQGQDQMQQFQQQPDQSQQQQQMFLMAMMEDMQRTGGKNLAKIQTIAQFADKMGGAGQKPLNTTAATQVSQFDNSLANLNEVESLVNQLGSSFGPVKGRLNSLNPYNETQANINQATLVAAQNIGRALEGGKLTDADIARYQKALPNINDTPQIAQDKINRLRKLIQQQRQNYIQNVSGSQSDSSSLISGLNGLLGS